MERGLGRAAVAAGAGVQQLMNRLTDHLWLYDKAEAQARANPSRRASKEKAEVLRWFEGLSVEQRQEILLVKDREWVDVLLQMQRKLKSGPMNFFLMLDMGDPGARSGVLRSITPELLCRRPVGLLARLDAQNGAGRELTDNLLFFSSKSPELKQAGASVAKKGSSKKGKKKEAPAKKANGGSLGDAIAMEAHALTRENQVDVMVVTRAFLEDPQKLVRNLDRLTLGQFLQAPCGQQALGSWDETPWLHSMGYCALPFYIANRLELAIWAAWFKSNPARGLKNPSLETAKGRPKSRLSKAASQQQSGGASAVSSLEKHRSLQGWWQKLGVARKAQVLQAGVARLGRQLAVETVRDARLGRDVKEGGLQPAALDELGTRREGVSMRTSQKELASSQKGLQTVPWLAGLLALQELSDGGVLPTRRQSILPLRETEEGVSALSSGVVRQSLGSGRGKVTDRGNGRGDLEKELEWLMMTHGSREGAESEQAEEGLFCTSLELACTLRGRLLCRLRHIVQQLMQEHIAQDLLGSLETTAGSPEPSRGSKAGSSASKSAKKKKGSRTRGVSGSPEKEPADGKERSDQSKEVVRVSAGAAPSGKLPLDGEIAQQNKSGSGVADHKPSETETPSSLLEGAKQAVNTTPPDVYNRGAESMNETDEEERCSSSGEAWEEVGAAKRRKDRRRRLEDKDVKREPRKRALQSLEAPWAVPEGHAGQNGGTEAEGEHRKRRRRRKGKERKKEDASSEAAAGAAMSGGPDGSAKQKVAGTGSVSINGAENAIEGLRHRGWNLAAPAFEPRSVPKPTSILEGGRLPARGSGLGPNQNGLSGRPKGFTPYQAGEASIRTGVSTNQFQASSRSHTNQGGLILNGTGVRPNENGSATGGGSDRASPRTAQGVFKRSLSVGNSPDDEPSAKSTAETVSSAAPAQPSTLVVPITPLKHAPRQPKPPAGLSTSLSDGSRSQEPAPAVTKAVTQGISLQEESRHRCHEWPQYHGGLAPAPDASREQFAPATPAETGPAAPNGPVHVTGFVVPKSSRAANGFPHHDSRDLHLTPHPAQPGIHVVSSLLAVSDSSSQVTVPPNPALPSAPQHPNPDGTPSGPETLTQTHFQQPGDFPPAFLRPVAIHRSRSSHQLPDNGFPVEPPGPFWEANQFHWAGRPLPGGVDPGAMKPPEQWPIGFQPGMQSLSPESQWPPNLPRITVPAADYYTDEDWLMGGGEDYEGSGRNGNAYDMESEAEANGRYVMSETEVEGPRVAPPFVDAAQDDSRVDYSRIFDGGVLYWTADNYSTLGASRPNSLSSNDSMWIRREADISVIVDDIAGAASPSYVAADVSKPADVSTSPAPSERAASPLPDVDPPETVRARMPRVRAVRLQGSRPSPVLVRTNLAHTPPRSVYRGLSPDLRYHRGLSPDTFVRHLPSYQVAPLARQGSVGAGKESGTGDIRWKRPSSPVLRFNPSPNHAPPAVPPLASAPRARPANVRSGSSSPRHWAPALEKGEKAPGIDAEGSFRGGVGAEFAPGGGGYILREKLAAVAGSGGFGRNVNPMIKKGLPPLAPVTHSPDQDHPDLLIPIHHWVTIPPFNQQLELVRDQPDIVQDVVSVDPAGFGEETPLHPVVPFSPVTPLSPPGTQQAPNEWALFHDLLHKEVERFCGENREEMAKKRPFQLAAITKVSKALQVLWPRSRITVFGSFITGLALPTSDIDLLVGLPPVRSLEPIKEAGILEGRNGIKETMLQHAARYLADQDWVKTDSMKTIENTAVPIIQLVAQMPLQPLQASSSPSEKTPEERSGNGSPSEARGLASEDPPGDVSLIGVPGERSIPAELPGGAAELAEGGVGASGGAVGETAGVAGVDSLGCPVLWEAAHSTAEEANGVAGLREVLHDGGEPAPSGGKSMEGASDRHENGVLERGAPERRTGGVSSLGAESTMKSNSCPLTSVGAEPPGSGPPPPGEAAAATPAGEPSADVSTTSLADVSTEMGTSDRGSADVRDEPAEHGLDGRRHSAPGEVVPDEPVKGGHVAPPEAAKIGWRGHVAMVRTRPGGGDVAGPDSPGDQERRLVKLDISFEGVQHTGSRTTDLVRELVAQFPPLPPLVLVLKQFLTDRSLDHPYTGGLSSYCLVLLVTRFLQHQQHVSGVRAQQAGQNLGLLLMDFLHFFGCVFDPRRMGVSIRAGGMYIDRDKGHSIDPLYIEDPLNPLNNVGRNCFRILQCTKAFGEGYVLLSKQLHQLDAKEPQANLFGKILTKCSA